MLNLDRMNTKQPASEGAKMHLRHPVFGHALYANKDEKSDKGADEDGRLKELAHAVPVYVIVRGSEAPQVQKRVKIIQKKAVKRKGNEGADEDGIQMLSAMIMGFENLAVDGKALTNTDEDKRAFIEMSDNFVEQVMEFAQDNSNFFKTASDN